MRKWYCNYVFQVFMCRNMHWIFSGKIIWQVGFPSRQWTGGGKINVEKGSKLSGSQNKSA